MADRFAPSQRLSLNFLRNTNAIRVFWIRSSRLMSSDLSLERIPSEWNEIGAGNAVDRNGRPQVPRKLGCQGREAPLRGKSLTTQFSRKAATVVIDGAMHQITF
jgi:hypothetical protein